MKLITLLVTLLSIHFANSANAQSCEQLLATYLKEQEASCDQIYDCSNFIIAPDASSPGLMAQMCRPYDCQSGQPMGGGWGWNFRKCDGTPLIIKNVTGIQGQAGSCQVKGNTQSTGSVVGLEGRTLGEKVPVVGAFELHYSSVYQPGRKADFKLNVPLSYSVPRDYITSFVVETRRAGVLLNTQTIANTANKTYTYTWNGLNASNAAVDSQSFDITIKENSPAGTIQYKYEGITLGHWNANKIGLGGWLPSVLRKYDFLSKRLYYPTGEFRIVEAKLLSGSQYFIPSEDGKEVYIVDSTGRHLFTKTGLLGTTVLTFAYDTSGRLSSITEPFNRKTLFNRNASGLLTSVTSPFGQITQIAIDSNGFISNITDPMSQKYEMTYSGASGLISTFTKPNGEKSTFTYDADGFLNKDAHSGGYFFNLAKINTAEKNFDVEKTTVLGRKTRVQSTDTGSSVAQTQSFPDGMTYSNTFSIDGSGSISSSFNGAGLTSNISSVAHPRFGIGASFVNYSYVHNGGSWAQNFRSETVSLSDVNNPFSVAALENTAWNDGSNEKIVTTYNPTTKRFQSTTFLGKSGTLGIDSYERPILIQAGNLNATSFGYTNDFLTTITQGARKTTLTYNTAGLLSSVTNPLNQKTVFNYDAANRMSSKYYPDGRFVTFAYDTVGNLVNIAPPGKPLHAFTMNTHGLIGGYAPPLLAGVSVVNTTYSYNLDKQLTKISRPDGKSIDFTYNPTSGLLEKYVAPNGTYVVTTNPYSGLPGRIDTPSGVSTDLYYYARDLYGSSTAIQGVQISDFQNRYGQNFKVTSDRVGLPTGNGSEVTYLYNDDGDLSQAGELNLAYNTPNGQLTGTTFGTGSTGFTDAYTYNAYGELIGYVVKRGTSQVYSVTYGHNTNGQKIKKTQVMNGVTNVYDYTYDSSARLTKVAKNSVVVSNYGYDGNSNRNSGNVGAQTTTATYDNQDRLTAYNNFSFTYNANGDLLTKKNNTTNQTTTYTYDVFGNLTKVVIPGGTTIEYDVDGLNRRIGKKVNGVLQKRWVWMDQYRIAAELKANGEIYRRFVYGSKSNVPDYMITPTAKYRIISDHLGSVRMIMSPSGNLVQRMDHDEFGRVIEDTVPGVTPFGFAGGMYDSQTGLVRFGARDYDPEIGRWTSKDPVGFRGGNTNLYGYVLADPVQFVDSTGRSPTLISGGIGFLLGAVVGGVTAYANNQNPLVGALTTGAVGFAVGSGGALVASMATAAGYGTLNSLVAGSVMSGTIAKSADIVQQQLSGKPINLKQTAGAAAIGMCSSAMAGSLGTSSAIEFATGVSFMPLDILNGLSFR